VNIERVKEHTGRTGQHQSCVTYHMYYIPSQSLSNLVSTPSWTAPCIKIIWKLSFYYCWHVELHRNKL